MRWLLLSCLLSIPTALAMGEPADASQILPADTAPIVSDKPSGQQPPPPIKGEDPALAEKQEAPKNSRAQGQKEPLPENDSFSLMKIDPRTGTERALQEQLTTKIRSLHSHKEKAETEEPQKGNLKEELWEDFKWPLIILGGIFLYFIPSLLGMKRNDFKKVFWINLLSGWTGAGWIYALVRAFSKDSAPPPEDENRRRRRSSRRRRH